MPGTEQQLDLDPDTIASVNAWRMLTLLEAGYDQTNAELLANRHDIDLHKATDLLNNGCDETTALQILL